MQLLDKLIPGFKDKAYAFDKVQVISYCAPVSTSNLSEGLTRLTLNKLQAGANNARSDDTARLKVAIAEWLNSRTPPSPREVTSYNTRLSTRGKEERGISNDITGRLLCPIDYNWDDPEYFLTFLFWFNLIFLSSKNTLKAS